MNRIAANGIKRRRGTIFFSVKDIFRRIKDHLPEYLIEAWCLGTFMVSACMFGILFFHPDFAAARIDLPIRSILMWIAMGATAVAIITSPWGKRSGAHFNPAVTLAYLRLGKIDPLDAAFYVAAHFVGGTAGVLLAWSIFGDLLMNSAVNFVVTVPGAFGVFPAFIAECVIAFVLMSVVLFLSNSMQFARFTPFAVGSLVALYIAIESPISGMSMNPARTFASSIVAGNWTAWWIYFLAPLFAMLTAAELFVRTQGIKKVLCAKLSHFGKARCIFNCSYPMETKLL